jgi:hypothetical protein
MADESNYITDARVRSMRSGGKSDAEIAETLGITAMDVQESLVRTIPELPPEGPRDGTLK